MKMTLTARELSTMSTSEQLTWEFASWSPSGQRLPSGQYIVMSDDDDDFDEDDDEELDDDDDEELDDEEFDEEESDDEDEDLDEEEDDDLEEDE